MEKQPDWGKRGVYAAYFIGIPTLLLAAFAYFRPADPAHPISFDFLFHTVSIPIWLLISLLIIAIVLALAFRILSPRITESMSTIQPALKTEILRPPAAVSALPKRLPQPKGISQDSDVVIHTAAQLEIHIKADNSSDMPVLGLRIDNNRLDAIHELDVIVYSAFSFDSRHNQFRTHAAATGARIGSPNLILPSESSQVVVLVHRRAGQNNLQLGNDTSREMKWPENDKTKIQRWKLNVSIGARAYSRTMPPTGEVFQPSKFDLIADWDTTTSRLSVQKA